MKCSRCPMSAFAHPCVGESRPQACPAGPKRERFPDRTSGPGRVRVGIVSPCCFMGGAERWISNLLDHSDGSRIDWIGIVITQDMGENPGPNLLADWQEHAMVQVGNDALRDLASKVDLLLTWGVCDLPWGIDGAELERLVPPSLPVITVSHGALEYSGGTSKLTRAIPAAVSRAALGGVTSSKRDRARIILNGVSADRVARRSTREAIRAEWGLSPGAKVAGWLGRLSSEKGFVAFVDGVSRLPDGWVGVMAGSGHGEAEAKARAAQVADGRVIFLGGRSDIGDVLAAFDGLVMPSATEACSIAAAEAWLAGCPLISTPVGLLEDHPDLAALIPRPATGEGVAAAVLADFADPAGQAARVDRAKRFAETALNMDRFGREWTGFLLSLAPIRPEPNLLTKAASMTKAVGKFVASGAKLTPPGVLTEREALCNACPDLDKQAAKCRVCGCQLKAKRAMASESCPAGKWPAV